MASTEPDRTRDRPAAEADPRVQPYYDDEISLVDLAMVLIRRRWALLGVFILTVAAGAAWVAVQTPVYETHGTVAIGQLDGEPLEDPDRLVTRLERRYQIDADASLPRISGVEHTEGVLTLTARAHTPEQSFELLEAELETLLERHNTWYESFVEERGDRLDELNARIGSADTQLGILSEQIENLGADTAITGLLTLEHRIGARLPELEAEREEVKRSLAAYRTRASEAVSNPQPPERPVEPRTALVLALSTVLGLMLALFAAFIAEFVAQVRAQSRNVA